MSLSSTDSFHPSWIPIELSQREVAEYGLALSLKDSDSAMAALARAIACAPVWTRLPPTILVVRRSPYPSLAMLGQFQEPDMPLLEALIRNLHDACSHLRYLSYSEAESECHRLAELLVSKLGRDRLARASFRAVPRGGTIVLGMLAQILDLEPRQLTEPPDLGDLIVVDDCALSGSRFKAFLKECRSESVVFAHLYSHPDLRRSIEDQEPRVIACISTGDLESRETPQARDSLEWRQRWEERLGEKRYWLGPLDHICFPWTEPDRVIWNSAQGKTELAWRVIPPELCLKNRVGQNGVTAEVQTMPKAGGAWAPGPRVFFASQGDRTLIANLETGDCLSLEDVARDMWHSLLQEGEIKKALEGLTKRYEIEPVVLEADFRGLIDRLTGRGFLEPTE